VCISGITFIRYAQNRKIGNPTNCKVLGAIKPEGSKQDIQNRPRPPMLEGGEL